MNTETIVAAAIGGAVGVFLNGLFTFLQRRADMKYKNAEIRSQLVRESNERQATAVGNFIDVYRLVRRDSIGAMTTWGLTKWESEKEKNLMRVRQEYENVISISAAFDVLRLVIVHPKMQPIMEELQERIGKFDYDLLQVLQEKNTYKKWVPVGSIEPEVLELLATANKHLVYNPAIDPFPGFFVK